MEERKTVTKTLTGPRSGDRIFIGDSIVIRFWARGKRLQCVAEALESYGVRIVRGPREAVESGDETTQ